MKILDIKINDLTSKEYQSIIDRAEERIEEAILNVDPLVSKKSPDDDLEIPSFPIAVIMVASTDDNFLKKRYALAEAKRVSHLLEEETKEKIIEVAKNFNWRIRQIKERVRTNSLTYDFALHFTDFVKNASIIRAKKWKLVNRAVLNGQVYLTKNEAARLLEEEVRRHIEGRLEIKVGSLPQSIMNRVERLKHLFTEIRGKLRLGSFPKRAVIAAYPPCITNLYDATASGRRVPHIGRFTLTSFLINIGMTIDDIVDLFRSFTDFNERITRYQVEHIAGEKGSRTKYIPPLCDTLRTHGLCPGMDEICRTIRHPLAYYRKKLRVVETEVP